MGTNSKIETEAPQADFDFGYELLLRLADPPESVEKRQLTGFLRQLQRTGYEFLKEALDDPTDLETTWDEPVLGIPIDYPWNWVRRTGDFRGLVVDASDEADCELFRVNLAIQSLTGGAAEIVEGEHVYPLVPVPLGDTLSVQPEEDQRRFLEKFWAARHFGDGEGEYTIVGRSSSGRRFKAALVFFLHPLRIEPRLKRCHHLVDVRLVWEGDSSPEDWSTTERDALWACVFALLDELLLWASKPVDKCQPKLSVRVSQQAPGYRAFDCFDALITDRTGGHPFPEKCSAPSLEQVGLGEVEIEIGGPELPLTDGTGRLLPQAVLNLLTVMVYPNSEESQKRFLAAQLLHSPSIEDAAHLPEGAHALLEIHRLIPKASSVDSILQAAVLALRAGARAGDIFLWQLLCSESHPEHAGVGKAIHFYRSIHQAAATSTSRRVWSRAKVLPEWKRFKPVAHLWAALLLWQRDFNEDPSFDPFRSLDDEAALVRFLSLAEELRRRGRSILIPGKGTPVIDPEATWRAPADLQLGSFWLRPPALTDADLAVLAPYPSEHP